MLLVASSGLLAAGLLLLAEAHASERRRRQKPPLKPARQRAQRWLATALLASGVGSAVAVLGLGFGLIHATGSAALAGILIAVLRGIAATRRSRPSPHRRARVR